VARRPAGMQTGRAARGRGVGRNVLAGLTAASRGAWARMDAMMLSPDNRDATVEALRFISAVLEFDEGGQEEIEFDLPLRAVEGLARVAIGWAFTVAERFGNATRAEQLAYVRGEIDGQMTLAIAGDDGVRGDDV
jgi:hypothetical protein